MLVYASRSEVRNPKEALNLYLKLARNNNCFARQRLSQAYLKGSFVEKNVTQAHFWLLLAKVGGFRRRSKYDVPEK